MILVTIQKQDKLFIYNKDLTIFVTKIPKGQSKVYLLIKLLVRCSTCEFKDRIRTESGRSPS